ncbi:MAG TPA: carbohydrate porin [Phycisphaerales bacterium]|nr:carbohydrate porin [Phycisphaerales bacterium]
MTPASFRQPLTGCKGAALRVALLGSALVIGARAAAQATPEPPAEPAPETGSAAETPPGDQGDVTPDDAGASEATDPLPPTTIDEELHQVMPGAVFKRLFDEIAAETNLRLGVAHTMLFQQATGGPGERTAAGGDLDLFAKWTAIGAGTKDTGILAFATEYRYQIGDLTPSALGGQIGTLIPTTNSFGERTFTVKELYWDQRLFEDRFRFVVGRLDPENLFGGHKLQSANLYFLNKAFSGNPAIAFPGSGLTAAALVRPLPWMYIDGGINDANGKTTSANFEGFFKNHEYLFFTEFGLTPTIEGVGAGRYRVALWQIDSREEAGVGSDGGITVSLDQDIGSAWTVFARYAHSDGDATGITNTVQGGFGLKDVLGKDNMFGLAAGWAEPLAAGQRDEKVVEAFQRFQITETAQLTFSVQAIVDPSRAPGDDVVGVFSVRLRISF